MLPLLNLVQRHASGANISVGGQGREGERVGRGGMIGESGRCQMTSLIIAMNTTHMPTPHQYLSNCRYALFVYNYHIVFVYTVII